MSMSALACSLSHIPAPLIAPTTRAAKFTVLPKTSLSSICKGPIWMPALSRSSGGPGSAQRAQA